MGLFGELIDQSEEQSAIEKALSEIDKSIFNQEQSKKVHCDCHRCSLKSSCTRIEKEGLVYGAGHRKILIIDGSPSKNAYISGDIRSGIVYDALDAASKKAGIDLERDCWITHAVQGYTPEKLSDSVVKKCGYQLFKTVKSLKPEKIIVLGGRAMKALIGRRASSRVKSGDIDIFAGNKIPDVELQSMVFPVYNPLQVSYMKSFVLDKRAEKLLVQAFKNTSTFTDSKYRSECGYLKTEEEAIDWIKTCQQSSRIAIDYETTGIKPHRKGHRILCMSISNGLLSFGFKMYEGRAFHSELAKLLMNPKIQKIAHNMKFEENWTREILGYSIEGWYADPMLTTHILDNRRSITGLKYQTYMRFGELGYDNALDPYMEKTRPGDDPESFNSFNMLEYAPIEELCLYCAQDSHFTYHLANVQRVSLDRHRSKGLGLFFKATQNYVGMESHGVRISDERLKEARKNSEGKLLDAESAINRDPDVARWRDEMGRVFDYGSDDLKHFVYEFMGEPVLKTTKAGNKSLDNDVLEELAKIGNSKVYSNIQTARKWSKVLEYIAGISREVMDGVLHCFFNLNNVTSYRTSSSNINLQNIPKRDEVVKKILRSVFIPLTGHLFIEYDFKAFEVSMYACYSQDETLIKYVRDQLDMHQDMSAYIMGYTWEAFVDAFGFAAAKKFRQETKSGFVFSQLYGAGAETCAQYFWDFFQTDEGAVYKEHVLNNLEVSTGSGVVRIKDFATWLLWIESVEDYFWNQLFPKLGEWREANWREYIKTGQIKYFTGFYATGVMKKTQATNFPVQGTASSVKLMVMNLLAEKLEKDNAKSRLFCEIHDSLVLDADPSEEEYLDDVMRWIVDVKIPELCPWAVVPFYIEKSAGEIDGSWDTVDEIGLINAA